MRALLSALALVSLLAAPPVAAKSDPLEIPYSVFELDNGLTVVVHEDRKAPIVAVNVWYHVGSKDEKPGKTGFAHLFEHLMFNGSENWNDEYFVPFQKVGATEMNGTTNFDRTNYFANVPTSALDLALWMESDRMGHLLGAVDQAKLDEQRGVVQNEKRQGENQPYGRVFSTILSNIYPEGHPYSWSTIGSMEDLNEASLEDVQEWFKTYYGPNNAVIVLAGDIDVATAKEKVTRYFGDIPAGPPLTRRTSWVAQRSEPKRAILQDRVPQVRIYKAWNVPGRATPEIEGLSAIASLLAGDRNSRLYKRLVYTDQTATDVGAFALQGEIAGTVLVFATVRPGGDPAQVEAALDEELAEFKKDGPARSELERVKTQARAELVRDLERIGGFGGKSDLLAAGTVFAGSPDYYRTAYERLAAMSARDLRDLSRTWLGPGVFTLEVQPFAEGKVVASDVDRKALPYPDEFPAPAFPAFTRSKLSNGLEVIVAERHEVPNVEFNLVLDAGFAADQLGTPGTASITLDMLPEGAGKRSGLELAEALAQLGAEVDTSSTLDTLSIQLSALTSNLDASLALYSDVILAPTFPQKEFERVRRNQIAAIQREKVTPTSMALRTFPKLLYGEGHAYGLPLTGSGTEASVSGLERDALVEFHRRWFLPNNGTLIVVGDTTQAEIVPKLEKLFAGWKAGEVPTKNIAQVPPRSGTSVYLVDRPGSEQSLIFAGHVAPPKGTPNDIAIDALNTLFGGNFSSRINMNLREDKNWSYGARSILLEAAGERPFFVFAPVQTDKTRESMAEIDKELHSIVADRAPTEAEVDQAKNLATLTLPGRWETAGAVSASIAQIVRFGLADDYWAQYPDKVRALDAATVDQAGKSFLQPDGLVWVVVGDRARIEAGIRELALGEIRLIDADGNVLDTPAASGAATEKAAGAR